MRNYRRYMFPLLMMLLCMSCIDEGENEPTLLSGASLTLQFGGTRAAPVTGPTGSVAEGFGMSELLLFVADDNSTIVHREEVSFSENSNTRHTVRVENLKLGNYTIYAYANYKQGGSVVQPLNDIYSLQKNGTFSYSNQIFPTLTGTTTPAIEGEKMLLTAEQGITINAGENSAIVEMLRPYARFTIRVNNISDRAVTINHNSLQLPECNSSTSYVLSHGGTIPDGNTYRQLLTDEQTSIVTPNENVAIYSTLLYENDIEKYEIGLSAITMGVLDIQLNEQFVITVVRDGKTYYLCSDGADKAPILVEEYKGENCMWTFTEFGNGYTIACVGDGLNLAIDKKGEFVKMSGASGNSEGGKVGIDNMNGDNQSGLLYSTSGSAYYVTINENNEIVPTRNETEAIEFSFYKSIQTTAENTTTGFNELAIDKMLRNQDITVTVNIKNSTTTRTEASSENGNLSCMPQSNISFEYRFPIIYPNFAP